MKRRVEELSFNPTRPGGGGGVVSGLSGASGTGAAAVAAAATVLSNVQQHRVLSTTQNLTQTSNNIQYQMNPGVLKVTSVPVSGNNNNNNSNSTSGGVSGGGIVTTIGGGTLSNSTIEVINSCSAIIGGQNNQTTSQPQFGTYPNAITVSGATAANLLARTPGGPTQIIGSGSQQQQVHVVNTTQNLIRHKPATVTVAQPPTVIGGNGTSIVTLPSQQVTMMSAGPQQQQQQQQHLSNNMISVTATGGVVGGGGTAGGLGVNVTTTNQVTTASVTTTPIGNPPPTPPTSNGAVQFQRLKVEDALVYLDNVKSKFGDQPQVYNDFLDIMKEFKSQSIDTPGVIERVSTLFKGHPDLIVGFNTFLPPGYKIEIQANDTGYSYQVSVSMPDRSSTTCGPSSTVQQHSPSPKLQIINQGTMVTQTGPVNLVAHPPMVTNQVGGGGTLSQIVSSAMSGTGLSSNNNSAAINLHNNGSVTSSGVNASPGGPSLTFVRNDKERGGVSSGAISINLTSAAAMRGADEHGLNHGSTIHQVAHHVIQGQSMQHPGDAVGLDGQPANQNQPVEFQSAISYVNKIKKRFQNEPDKYKRFLEILHQYQKEQKTVRGDAQQKPLTEQEVYSQVAILFDKNEDLLKEFGKFLPDAANHSSLQGLNKGAFGVGGHVGGQDKKLDGILGGGGGRGSNASGSGNSRYGSGGAYSRLDHRGGGGNGGAGGPLSNIGNHLSGLGGNDYNHHYGDYKDQYQQMISGGGSGSRDNKERGGGIGNKYGQVKRSPSFGNSLAARNAGGLMMDRAEGGQPPSKKHKSVFRDVSLAEASKYGSLNEYAFFDKVRRALRNAEVYDNFLRCLILFNQEIVTKAELLNLTSPFLVKHPELHKWFQDFVGPMGAMDHSGVGGVGASGLPYVNSVQGVAGGQPQRPEHSQEIDLSTCKRLGASYCALPKTSELRKCSGRTALCREVLNDTWVSFPTWAEDSTFVTSRKTQYEELIYRCEDERFELDVVIETNSATIRVLEGVHKKMSRMSVEELMGYRLDDCLGGSSPTIHQRALRRIYGEKASDIIQGLKRNPSVAVPVVLRRLKGKEEEWREAQKGFNKQWRDQNEKYYLKSLDHQGINFKQTDTKSLRSKSLFNDIETLYDERHEHNEDHSQEQVVSGPHLVLPYKDKTILEDATNLLIHHVKRQTGVQKQEKSKIKHILRQFVPDLFFSPRQQLSDDEREESNSDGAEGKEKGGGSSGGSKSGSNSYLASGLAIKEEALATEADKDVEMEDVSGKEKGSISEDAGKIKEEPDKDNTASSLSTSGSVKNMEEEYTLFFANNNWYLFLRLHAILCERLRTMYERAQILAAEEAQYKSNRRESTATALRLKARSEIQVEDYYPTFLDMLKNVLDGNLDGNNFEDSLREMFGIHAYIAFTLDRVVQNAVRQLQHCVTERAASDCVALFTSEQKQNGTGGLCRTASKRTGAELAYQRKAEQKLQDENCFKVYIYKIECRVTIELLDTESDETEKSVSYVQEWSSYVERYSNPGTGPAPSAGQNNGSSGYGSENKAGCAGGVSPMDTSSTGDGTATNTSTTTSGSKCVNSNQRDGVCGEVGKDSNSSSSGGGLKKSKGSAHSASDGTAGNSRDNEESDKSGGRKRRPLFLRRNIRNKATLASRAEGVATIGPNGMVVLDALRSSTGKEGESRTEEQQQQQLKQTVGIGGVVKEDNKGATARSDYQIVDNTEVKLNVNSYKMIWVTNKNGLFYKRNSISKARKNHPIITKRLKARFSEFTDKWAARNVSKVQETQCSDWMLGKLLLENSQVASGGSLTATMACRENDLARTPYYLYNRYKVFKGDR